jgi:hypothetical protein
MDLVFGATLNPKKHQYFTIPLLAMIFQTALPLWTRIASAASEVAALTAASIDFAKLAAHAAVSQRRREKDQQPEVLQFEEVAAAHSESDHDIDDASVASDASFGDHLDSGARRIFRTPSLRPNQRAAVKRIVLDPESEGKLLLCERTGAGKSLRPRQRNAARSRLICCCMPEFLSKPRSLLKIDHVELNISTFILNKEVNIYQAPSPQKHVLILAVGVTNRRAAR